MRLLNGITAIPALDQIPFIAIRHNARLLRLWALRRRRRRCRCCCCSFLRCAGAGAGGWRTGDSNTIVVPEEELRAIAFHGGVPSFELCDCEGAEFVGDDLAGVAGDGLVVFRAGGDDTCLGWGRAGGGGTCGFTCGFGAGGGC